jgi:FdhD protein
VVRPASPLRRHTTTARVVAVREESRLDRPDSLATEEPMEIRVGGPGQAPVSLAVTMRTPGNDFELASGFLFTEGIIESREDLVSVGYCDLPPGEQLYNVVTVGLARPFDHDAVRRNFYATSSCGVCGKASLDQIKVRCPTASPGPIVARSVVLRLPAALREAQRIFDRTGGLHAAGLFDQHGRTISVREDVGRHNAVDKLVGQAFLERGIPLSSAILLVSGRVSFEIVQKAAVAGIPIVTAVSAPTSLAVESAGTLGMTVVGFVRDRGFNVYTHPERIDMER